LRTSYWPLTPPRRHGLRRRSTFSTSYEVSLNFGALRKSARLTAASQTAIQRLSVVAVDEPTDPSAAATDDFGRAFILTLSGPFEEIESRREPLAGFLKSLEFELIYVLRDQVSEQIACKLYPHLYRIENLLRGYLIRFMATHIGPRWWELSASAEMADKAKKRKKNERVFGKYIENSAYLIDFDELGELVYEHSSGYLTREAIIERVTRIAETPEAVRTLKQELRSNYYKLFKESFADRNFKDKWTQFEALRNKVAHNNLFTAEDLVVGERLAAEITEIISAADVEAEKLVITNDEREAIKQQVIARSDPWREISEDVFLAELDAQERYYADKPDGFVGLTKFVSSYLGSKGYSYASSHEIIQQLQSARVLEVYYVSNPFDDQFKTAAIRRVKPSDARAPVLLPGPAL
jgi:hypothetical protein